MTQKQQKETEKLEALKSLHKLLKPGDTVYCSLKHVSSSDMSRRIDFFVAHKRSVRSINGLICEALGYRWNDGVVVGGRDMDMGFSVVYSLSSALYKKSFRCIGEKYRSNDHSNGDRDRTSHLHPNGGYALTSSWL